MFCLKKIKWERKKVEITESQKELNITAQNKRKHSVLLKKQYFERNENFLLKNVSKETYFSFGVFLTTHNYLYLVLTKPELCLIQTQTGHRNRQWEHSGYHW